MFRMVSDRVPRREFLRAAVAIGGSAALSACVDVELGDDEEDDDEENGDPEVPTGVDDPSELPARQHAWNDYVVRDRRGNTTIPRHQIVLGLEYRGDGSPTEADRETVEEALQSLERAYQWGTGGRSAENVTEGLLFTIGYTRSYFDRFEEPLPESVDLPRSQTVLDELGEDEAEADEFDAALVMNSDYAHVVLAAEEALKGELDELNGVEVTADLSDVFEVVDRRSGFVGTGLPHEHLDDQVPEDAPMSMGFKSGVLGNQSPEDFVTIDEGPFAEGTTQMLSRIAIDVEEWYDRDAQERVHLMFSPDHDLEDVGEFGDLMTDDSGTTQEVVDRVDHHAEEHGTVGHAQKTAAARTEGFLPRILRRSEGVSDDLPEPSMNFTSVQETMEDFVETRQAMNRDDFDGVPHHNNGILAFLETRRRGSLLVPPRGLRALPLPDP